MCKNKKLESCIPEKELKNNLKRHGKLHMIDENQLIALISAT